MYLGLDHGTLGLRALLAEARAAMLVSAGKGLRPCIKWIDTRSAARLTARPKTSHTVAPGGDLLGWQTFEPPWFANTMEAAKRKADVAFEMFQLLGVPYYCFHDADVHPEGADFAENTRNLNEIAAMVHAEGINPNPRSGKQAYLENLVNRFV